MRDLCLKIFMPMLFQSMTADISTTKAVLEQVVTQDRLAGVFIGLCPSADWQRNVAIHFLS